MPPEEDEDGDMDGERKLDFSDMVMTKSEWKQDTGA